MRTPLHLLSVALVVGAVACGSDDSRSEPPPEDSNTSTTNVTTNVTTDVTTEAGTDATNAGRGYLTSVCPNPIKIQLQWYPQPDPYAMAFGLISDGTLDEEAAAYTGPAVADPDQMIEIIGGGPLSGYQSSTSLLYADPDILLADMNLDESIANSATFPTVAVIGPFVKSPLAFMFNPDVHDFETIEDIKAAGTTVLVTQSAVFAQAMIGLGLLDESQVDFSFDFGPARFVDSNGDVAQQSFITHDPYEFSTSEFWGKPVDQVLMADGYPTYQNVLTVIPEKITTEADCLERLVPLLQQSMIDYTREPAAIDELMVDLSDQLSNPAGFTSESLQFVREMMESEGLLGNTEGTSTFGSFDMDRVEHMVEILAPVFDGQDNYDPAVTADQVATSQFIDADIGFEE